MMIDGIVLSLMLFGASRMRSPKLHIPAGLIYVLALIYETLEVYVIYRPSENSDLFFMHPYLAWTIGNICMILISVFYDKEDARLVLARQLVLWQIVINTVFAGLTLCLAWLMKLYL